MANQNGNTILYALKELNRPADLKEIIAFITNEMGVSASEIEYDVKITLRGGVKYGYIQESNGKYYVDPKSKRNEHSIQIRKKQKKSLEMYREFYGRDKVAKDVAIPKETTKNVPKATADVESIVNQTLMAQVERKRYVKKRPKNNDKQSNKSTHTTTIGRQMFADSSSSEESLKNTRDVTESDGTILAENDNGAKYYRGKLKKLRKVRATHDLDKAKVVEKKTFQGNVNFGKKSTGQNQSKVLPWLGLFNSDEFESDFKRLAIDEKESDIEDDIIDDMTDRTYKVEEGEECIFTEK